MSYHPGYTNGPIAYAYWQFVSDWQTDKGELHRLGGQWFLLELASRFSFKSVRRILERSLPLAVARQKKDGGFDRLYPAGSACEVLLAYSRHQMVDALLGELRYDPRMLILRDAREHGLSLHSTIRLAVPPRPSPPPSFDIHTEYRRRVCYLSAMMSHYRGSNAVSAASNRSNEC